MCAASPWPPNQNLGCYIPVAALRCNELAFRIPRDALHEGFVVLEMLNTLACTNGSKTRMKLINWPLGELWTKKLNSATHCIRTKAKFLLLGQVILIEVRSSHAPTARKRNTFHTLLNQYGHWSRVNGPMGIPFCAQHSPKKTSFSLQLSKYRAPFAMSHMWTVLSTEALARNLESGDHDRSYTSSSWVLRRNVASNHEGWGGRKGKGGEKGLAIRCLTAVDMSQYVVHSAYQRNPGHPLHCFGQLRAN